MQTMKLRLLVSVFVFFCIGGAVYAYVILNSPQKPQLRKQASVVKEVSLPPNVEDLVKQSALEMINPTSTLARQLQTSIDPPLILVASSTTKSSACLESANPSYSCYEEHFASLVREKGVAAAFTDLKKRYEKSAYVQAMCHPFTHAIGHEAAEIYKDVGIAYTKGDSFCWSGYYHGVMEEIVGTISKIDLGQKINGICANIPGKSSYSFDYYNCVHGLGHGVMVLTENELFDALKLCDGLTGSWEQTSCYGGVFMENVMIDNRDHFTKYLKPSEPLYPCSAVEERYKSSCYLMQTSYMLKVNGGDFAKAFAACGGAEPAFRATCYQSVGRDASGRSTSNVSQTKTTCMLGKDFDQQSNCFVGAVKDFISYFHSDVQAKQLCDALDTQQLKDICHSTAKSYYRSL